MVGAGTNCLCLEKENRMSYYKKTVYLDLVHQSPGEWSLTAPERIGNAGFASVKLQDGKLSLLIQLRIVQAPMPSGIKDIFLKCRDQESIMLGTAKLQDGRLTFRTSESGSRSVGRVEPEQLLGIRIPISETFEVTGGINSGEKGNTARQVIDISKPLRAAQLEQRVDDLALDTTIHLKSFSIADPVHAATPTSRPTPVTPQVPTDLASAATPVTPLAATYPRPAEPTPVAAPTSPHPAVPERAVEPTPTTTPQRTPEPTPVAAPTSPRPAEPELAAAPMHTPVATPLPKTNPLSARFPRLDTKPKRHQNKWQFLENLYEVVHPFQDERTYLSIAPADMMILSEEDFSLRSNNFLLHGFDNYKHLILGLIQDSTGKDEYYIGVPGVFHEQEKKMAILFGFEGFESRSSHPTEGTFGYYMKRVRI